MPNYTVAGIAWPESVALHDMCATARAALGGNATVGATYNAGSQTLMIEITGVSPTQAQVENAVRNWTAKTSQQVADAEMQADLARLRGQMQQIRNAIDGANNVTALKVACTNLCDMVTKITNWAIAQEKI